MTARLEASYRRWARWYPRRWREEMLGTLLDVAQEKGRARLTLRDRADLLVNGLAARTGISLSPAVRDGTASAALAAGAALSVIFLVLFERPGHVAAFRALALRWGAGLDHQGRAAATVLAQKAHLLGIGPFLSPLAVVELLFVVACVLALVASGRVVRIALALTAAAGVVSVVFSIAWPDSPDDRLTAGMMTLLALVAQCGSPRRARRQLLPGVGGWLAGLVLAFGLSDRWQGYDYLRGPWSETSLLLGVFDVYGLDALLDLALLAALVLLLVRRRTAAGSVLLSTLPWLAIWLGEVHEKGAGQWDLDLFSALLPFEYAIAVVLVSRSLRTGLARALGGLARAIAPGHDGIR